MVSTMGRTVLPTSQSKSPIRATPRAEARRKSARPEGNVIKRCRIIKRPIALRERGEGICLRFQFRRGESAFGTVLGQKPELASWSGASWRGDSGIGAKEEWGEKEKEGTSFSKPWTPALEPRTTQSILLTCFGGRNNKRSSITRAGQFEEKGREWDFARPMARAARKTQRSCSRGGTSQSERTRHQRARIKRRSEKERSKKVKVIGPTNAGKATKT